MPQPIEYVKLYVGRYTRGWGILLRRFGEFSTGVDMTPEGIHDLAGNVFEWVGDWYSAGYQRSASENPVGPASGDGRVVRGGSWGYVSRDLRSSNRSGVEPAYRNNNVGFRCAGEVFP